MFTVATGVHFLTEFLIGSFFLGRLILKYVFVAVGLYHFEGIAHVGVLLSVCRERVPFVVFHNEQDGEHNAGRRCRGTNPREQAL